MQKPQLNPFLHYGTVIALIALFILCVAWELWLDPLVPGGSIYFLKALPLMFAFYGVYKGNIYTMQWTSMLVLLYVLEGIVRWYADTTVMSQRLAMIETLLSLWVFFFAIFYVRPAKKYAKFLKKQ
ncbi:DUF2069 domain-containing protein [Pelistega europaea]|uniref:DUF2069 domain-containing protein n=1 Tax=Pelistega europaea TaxID=106147 RepID=A0A7Y4P3D2_9BURK|nr:DUF2069 domain-containing protein [Pelistega europaea]NOL48897.1 DUF2069 domain-containing protein [Pelistega europaea]